MNNRQRFLETMKFGNPDRLPIMEWVGFWDEVIDRWRNEGLSKYELELHLGVDKFIRLPFGVSSATNPFRPIFTDELIREEGDYEIRRNNEGAICRCLKEGPKNMPQWLKYPVSRREDFAEICKRLNPDTVERYPVDFDELSQTIAGSQDPVGIWAGSLFGWIRNWMGLEGFSYALYDDEAFIEEMMEYITNFIEQVLEKLLSRISTLDFAIFWEDMAYKGGSMLSPKHFKRLMVPRYKRLTTILRKYGIEIILVDCDGDCKELIPLWLESGLTGISPLEVASGMDSIELRKQYGKDLMLIGGIDKRALSKDCKAIKEEVIPKVTYMAEAGGWIPSLDHLVPPDIPLDNYRYYLHLLRKYGKRQNRLKI